MAEQKTKPYLMFTNCLSWLGLLALRASRCAEHGTCDLTICVKKWVIMSPQDRLVYPMCSCLMAASCV
eukprot:2298908-Ditylum_brightwellii.AAC.1